MTRHRIRSFLPFLILSTIVACGSAEHEAAEVATLTSALTGKVIYFGRLEVLAGQLKSADGTLPSRGESVTLRAFLPELSSFMCGTYGTYCMALYPKLYVRYTGTSTFQEVPGITQGSYNMRGPTANWGEYESNIDLKVPADADRIETYIYWGRISWSGWSCYLAYDMMECPDSFGISGDYLSNYGRNFRIDVQP